MFLVGKVSFVRGILYIIFQVGILATAHWIDLDNFAACAMLVQPSFAHICCVMCKALSLLNSFRMLVQCTV